MSRRFNINSGSAKPFGAAAIALLFVAGCTKTREAQLPDGVGADYFTKSELTAATLKLQASEDQLSVSQGTLLRADTEVSERGIEIKQAPERLRSAIRTLKLRAERGSVIDVEFSLDSRALTAFKRIENKSSLPAIEQQLALPASVGSGQEQVLVPIFQLPVRGYGKLVRAKNDLGEQTSTLRFESTEWQDATHIQLGNRDSDRTDVRMDRSDEDEFKSIYVRSKLNGKLFSVTELKNIFEINVNLPKTALVLLQVESDRLKLFEVTRLNSETLLPVTREKFLAAERAGQTLEFVRRCSPSTLEQLAPSAATDCVEVYRYNASVTSVRAMRAMDDQSGALTHRIVFRATPELSQAPFTKVQPRQILASVDDAEINEVNSESAPVLERVTSRVSSAGDLIIADAPKVQGSAPVDSGRTSTPGGSSPSALTPIFDIERTLVVSEMKDQEYLLRRTLEDSPNDFEYAFPGQIANLEIVKILFEKDRVRVVRADKKAALGSNSLDQATLLLFPAEYRKAVFRDEAGNPSLTARFVRTSFEDPQAQAVIDWTRNMVPNVSSTLDYMGIEQCFQGKEDQQASDVDNRLRSDGILNLSLSTIYAANTGIGIECAGLMGADYWSVTNTIFQFKERISLKKHVKRASEEPELNVPYESQRLMGFGLFTYSKDSPDRLGNTNSEATKVYLPSVWDIKNGKTIDYVLAGLPEGSSERERQIRERIIRATQEVIADWNTAFRRSLSGTSLQRAGDYLTLSIAPTEAELRANRSLKRVRMGDLDRNVIQWVGKAVPYGILGIGGSSPNPRSGTVENGSLSIYGGNLISQTEWTIRMAKARKEYLERSKVKGELAESTPPVSPVADPAPAGGVNPPPAPSDAGSRVRKFGLNQFTLPKELLTKNARLAKQVSQLASELEKNAPASKRLLEQLSPATRADLQGAIQHAFYQAYLNSKSSMKAGLSQRIDKEFSKNLLTLVKDRVSNDEYRRFYAVIARTETIEKLRQFAHNSGSCLFHRDGEHFHFADEQVLKSDELDLIVAQYKPLLAHEMGHNLSLRHNFIGSYDKANWKHSAQETTKRRYSSVMDYMDDEHEHYDGIGPYDVQAIRAAYTGLLEVHPTVIANPAVVGASIESRPGGVKVIKTRTGAEAQIQNGKFVHLNDLKKVYGVESWLNFGAEALRNLPLKPYAFCSDEESGQMPTCNVWDRGTTPLELVENRILDYKSRYALRNLPGDKLQFNWWSEGSYAGRLFGEFISVRQMLEELFYQLVSGGDYRPYVSAVDRGMRFFHEIIQTPEAPSLASDRDSRWQNFELEIPDPRTPEGQAPKTLKLTVPVERKALQSSTFAGRNRMRVRGIELDKIIAMIMLTERSWGFSRYEQISLRTSFPEYEKLRFENKNALDLPTMRLLRDLLIDQVTPAKHVEFEGIAGQVPLDDGMFKVTTTDSMRFYALLSSIMALDVSGTEASSNLAAHFRIMSGKTQNVPSGTQIVMEPGVDVLSPNELRFWALERADVAQSLIKHNAMLSQAMLKQEKLNALMKTWTLAILGIEPKRTQPANPTVEAERKALLEKTEKEIDALLADLPQEAGLKQMAQIKRIAQQMLQLSIQANPNDANGIEALRTQFENFAKEQVASAAVLEGIQSAISDVVQADEQNAQDHPLALAAELIPSGVIRSQRGVGFSNIQMLNRFLFMMHPELMR
jgi:hypothetical protein